MFQLQCWNFFENDEALFRLYSLVLLKEQNSFIHKHHFFLTAKNEFENVMLIFLFLQSWIIAT